MTESLVGKDHPAMVAALFKRYDPEGKGRMPKDAFSKVLHLIDADQWTNEAIQSLIDVTAIDDGGEVRYLDFIDWVFGCHARRHLTVMTVNMQYYSSYPQNVEAGRRRLREITSETPKTPKPDIICVQEGLAGRDEIGPATGYMKIVSSAKMAQSVKEMVYEESTALGAVDTACHEDKLVNEIYFRGADSDWIVVDSGVEQVSSKMNLDGGERTGRVSGPLALRSMAWVKLKRKNREAGPFAFVMTTHLTGGRFEDQFFIQQLAEERRMQPERAISSFKRHASPGDFGCLLGDFNATLEYAEDGPMHAYFASSVENALGVQADMKAEGILETDLELRFSSYMVSPFKAISRNGWVLAYDESQVGYTSSFGHLIDHTAMSCKVGVECERFITTNQRGEGKPVETDTPITDHNAVRIRFDLTDCFNVSPEEVGTLVSSLTVMSLNLQYYCSYPRDPELGRRRLHEITANTGTPAPDVICVQEGLENRDELSSCVNYTRHRSSASIAQSVTDMVYSENSAMTCAEGWKEELLVNELYLQGGEDSAWVAVDSGVEQVSTDLFLDGGENTGRVSGPLAVRSVVWVKLRPRKGPVSGPFVFVLTTHLTGGRFEDQFFVQQLAEERQLQPERAIGVFQWLSGPGDVGVLVGDFNATVEYTSDGPMHQYFTSSIANSVGVQEDSKLANIDPAELEERFKQYMVSPFKAIQKVGWIRAYEEKDVGATSAYGHLVDHMATSCRVPVKTEKFILTNQRFPKTIDVDVPITDHNAVKATFDLPAAQMDGRWNSPAVTKGDEIERFTTGSEVETRLAGQDSKLFGPVRVLSFNSESRKYVTDCCGEVLPELIRWPSLKKLHIPGLPDETRGQWDRYYEVVDGGGHQDERGFPHSLGPFWLRSAEGLDPHSLHMVWGPIENRERHHQQWVLRGSAVTGFSSPVFEVALGAVAREAAMVPMEAQHFVWIYPPESFPPDLDESLTSADFLMSGAFVYFGKSVDEPPLCINTPWEGQLSTAPGKLDFGPPRRFMPQWSESMFQSGRLRPVRVKRLLDAGATHYCWIRPSENIGGAFLCPKGGFAYLFRSASRP